MQKKVLIVAVNKDWIGISRLPSGLNRAGFVTYAICPKKSFISQTKYLTDSVCFPAFTNSRSKLFYIPLLYSFFKFKPNFVIPGDEESLLALQNLSNFLENVPFLEKIAKIIRKSLTRRENDRILFSKSSFISNCEKWGISVPKNIQINKLDQAIRAGRELGYPAILKLDEGYGSIGVVVCNNEKELIRKVSRTLEYSLSKEMKSFFKRFFFITLSDKKIKISIQKYIKGMVGHIPFCARDGVVLASNPMLRLKSYPGLTGPTSVSKGFNNEEIIKYADIVSHKLSYNGFGSLDFILEEETNKIFVIELNPRPTPSCHFSSSLVTYDLCSVYYNGFDEDFRKSKIFKNFTVAMYPNEKKRDPNSPYLKEAYHDIPLDDPLLLKALETQQVL